MEKILFWTFIIYLIVHNAESAANEMTMKNISLIINQMVNPHATNNSINQIGSGISIVTPVTLSYNISVGSTDTEVEDLLNNGATTVKIKTNFILPSQELAGGPAINQSEWIDNDEKNENSRQTKSMEKKNESSDGPSGSMVQGKMAVILAAVVICISVLAYVGLLTWRRFLEKRYGNREMLVDEDDFNDPNDMRHFSI